MFAITDAHFTPNVLERYRSRFFFYSSILADISNLNENQETKTAESCHLTYEPLRRTTVWAGNLLYEKKTNI